MTPSKLQTTPSKLPSTPLNTRLTPSRSHLTPAKPQARSPSKLTTHIDSEQPIIDSMTVVRVIAGSDAEDNNSDSDEAVTTQATPSRRRATIVVSSSESDRSEQPTSTVQQSENASTTNRRRGLQDLKETGRESNSWSDSSEDSDLLTAIPREFICITHYASQNWSMVFRYFLTRLICVACLFCLCVVLKHCFKIYSRWSKNIIS